jgi:monoamine oxidase
MLTEVGYTVTVLEASSRVGGRTMTARRGDKVTEVWDDGTLRTQTCVFDQDLYLNLGAGRIPSVHQRVLEFCRKYRVPLEPYIHTSTSNLFQTDKAWRGVPQQNRRIANDTRGYIAQDLAETVRKGSQAEDGLTPVQREEFLGLLVDFGRLDRADLSYLGSTRSGLLRTPSVTQPEEPIDPLRLDDLLGAGFWRNNFYQDSDLHWQTTSFQPVGGMDNIWRIAAAALPAGTIVFDAPVTGVRLDGDGVVVDWSRRGDGHTQRFDLCLSNIPLTVLRQQVALHNFTPDFMTAVQNAPFAASCKVGWQADQRFWESDTNQIYGGISWIDDDITQIWYPSNDYFSPTDRGTLTGAYCSYEKAVRLGARTFPERLRVARAAATKLHSEFASDAVVPERQGISIAWQKVQYQLGAWADWTPGNPAHKDWYATLIYPQGQDNFFVLGDQVSSLPGWQEGALMSAEWVVHDWIVGGRRAVGRSVQQVPDARELTTGER